MEARAERYETLSPESRQLILKLHGGSYGNYLEGEDISNSRLVTLEDAIAAYEYSKMYEQSALAGLRLLGVDASADQYMSPQLVLYASLSQAVNEYNKARSA